jgi:peptide/nickel transport system permease protein
MSSFGIDNLLILAGVAVFVVACRLGARSHRWRRAWLRLRRNRVGMISLVVISLYLLAGLLDSIRLPAGKNSSISILEYCFREVPREKSYSAPLAHSSYAVLKPEPLKGRHLLGTDLLGKDVLLQALKACRTALIIGGLTSLIYIPLGTLFGILAGYYRRWVDDVIQYVYSTFAAIPGILLLVAILMVLGKGLGQMSIALGITSWVGLCRLIRGETMRQSTRPYVEAARVLGQGNLTIMLRHILPNVMHLVIINFVLGFSGLVLSEAVLSYLGVGAPVGTASWGVMIDSARLELSREPVVWWYLAAATMALFFLVLSLNLLGDALRKAFDPRAG